MDKLVYLFELDSVRSSKMEAEMGQRAMFNEVVNNGNQIALTFNQITDSRAFLSVLLHDEMYECILELATKGVFRFSRYKEVRTPAQYIIESLNKNINKKKEEDEISPVFLYSAVPLKCADKEGMEKLRDALMFSDLTKYDEEIEPLKISQEQQAPISQEQRNKALFLRRFVELVLTLSEQKIAVNERKEKPTKKLLEIIKYFIELYEGKTKDFPESSLLSRDLLEQSLLLLSHISAKYEHNTSAKINDRSWWIERLRDLSEERDHVVASYATDILLAAAIVDLCYNYTVEDSIKNVSKHYQEKGDASLENDFERRILQYWKQSQTLVSYQDSNGEKQQEYIHEFMKEDSDIMLDYESVELPDWKLALRLMTNMSNENIVVLIRQSLCEYLERIKKRLPSTREAKRQETKLKETKLEETKLEETKLEETKKVESESKTEQDVPVYATDELTLRKEQKEWRNKISAKVAGKIILALIFIVVYCFVDIGIDNLQSYLSDIFVISYNVQEVNKIVIVILQILSVGAKIIFLGIVASGISGLFKIPDVLDSIVGIWRNLVDIYLIRRLRNNVNYNSYEGVIESEK